jgi:hypothetical protein
MKVYDFVEKFTINPERDIRPNFKLTKKIDIDVSKHKGCLNCGDEINNMRLKSSSWTSVQYCWACNHLIVISYGDDMSGISNDTVECFSNE